MLWRAFSWHFFAASLSICGMTTEMEPKTYRRTPNWVIAVGIVVALVVALAFFFTDWPLNHLWAPKISNGWLSDNDSNEGGSRKFSIVLNHEFPIGSNVNTLRSSLVDQGFSRPWPHCGDSRCEKLVDTSNELEYVWGGGPCSQTVRATWLSSKDGRITALEGLYFTSCM
jgi:hypothetical protein